MRNFLIILCLIPAISRADPPRVITDIAPVHSLVSMVMLGIGEPELLLPAGASPHSYALRPSDARALSEADLVFWVGADLTPWLETSLQVLAQGTPQIALLDMPDWDTLPLRTDPMFSDVASDAKLDPHAWLDPEVAMVWVAAIAVELGKIDPENRGAYFENYANATVTLKELTDDIHEDLGPYRARPYLVPHDAYQYFERLSKLPASAALSLSDAARPSPLHIQNIRARDDIVCVLSDPETSPARLDLITQGRDIQVGFIDPLGADIALGAEHYPAMMRQMAASFARCLR